MYDGTHRESRVASFYAPFECCGSLKLLRSIGSLIRLIENTTSH